ncbi:Crp/Fnr family transcriptional regulator [Streptococcus pyogenes]|uniref:Crp/Fnr family transcriptional regulator n=1 Tax=Streptococcus pyogenes TaxID=1314 RepID=UPI003DA0EB3B
MSLSSSDKAELGVLNDLLASLPSSKREAVLRAADEVTFAKDSELLRPGENWRHLWLVRKGALRLFYVDASGREATKNFFFEGQLLWPITASLSSSPANFFVAALEESVIGYWALNRLDALVGDEPGWLRFRSEVLQKLLDEKMWRERLFLLSTAAERYQRLTEDRPAWCRRVSLRHQASWLGIADVTLSRIRSASGPAGA